MVLVSSSSRPSSAISTGTNPGPPTVSADDALRCSCCRQTNSWLGCSPYRRATAEEVVAGSRLSATIRAFSSADQRRRRPTPVITSIRRKLSRFALVVALGLRIEAGPLPSPRALHPRRCQLARKVPLRRRLLFIGRAFLYGLGAMGE